MTAFRETTDAFPADPLAAATALAALGLAGMLITLLIMPRFSPLGPLLAGLGYLAVGAWSLVDPDLFVTAEPFSQLGLERAAVVATGAVALLLAMPMVLSIFSVQRWRHPDGRLPPALPAAGYDAPPHPAAPYPVGAYPATGYPAHGYPAPGYTPPAYPPPGYPVYGYPAPGYPGPGYPTGQLPGGAGRAEATLEMPAVSDDEPPAHPIPPLPGSPRPDRKPSPAPTSPAPPDDPTVALPPDSDSPNGGPAANPALARPAAEPATRTAEAGTGSETTPTAPEPGSGTGRA